MLLNSFKNATKTNPNLFLLKTRNRSLDSYSHSYSCLILSQSPSSSEESPQHRLNINAKDVVASFKDWFKSRNNALFDRIFTILSSQDHSAVDDTPSRRAADLALSHLNLRLTESFVLQVLYYGSSSKDVLSCLRFFDWAGRQPGFHHTRVTFHAIFKILSKAKFVSLMLDFLEDCMGCRYSYGKISIHNTLVIGYAMAGHPEKALHLLGKMRFQGLDLDEFSYHVLLNALVEDTCFDAVDMIARQISMRGFQGPITHTIMVKSLCKQNKLDEADAYLRRFVDASNRAAGYAVSFVVDAFCRSKRFHDAATLLEEFKELNVPMEHAYGIWLTNLGRDGKLTRALEFLKTKKLLDGYVPNVFSGMAYNYLINTLCGKGGADEAYRVLRNSMDEGYFPGKKTFDILADALCAEGKLDKMKELLVIALERNLMPSNSVYSKFIAALCNSNRVEEGYLVHGEVSRLAGYAKKPELARQIFEMMKRSGMEPTMTSDIIMLHSYLKNNRISDALNFFNDVRRRRGTIVRGLLRSGRKEEAGKWLKEMFNKGFHPTNATIREIGNVKRL
ncbi:hypothetical protein CCACVL1_30893 [Corchorus capsularis]|uniref:Pentacotripeptide-repeat region of PRORP domain-containing protein n=1 Tax=Corchorus capsularis TaxID=210143 RepID=A0A1R3FUW8_COCAP|nr:hypothetical protein CCACVL1_30893 [Corchorus capsularis]